MPASPPARASRVEVALPVPIDATFTYEVTAAQAPRARPGCRVVVPFGGRRLTGVIVEPRDGDAGRPAERLRTVARVLDDEPVLAPALLRILREAAEAVFCPVGLALASALPAGSGPRSAPGLALTPRGREALARGAVLREARPLLDWLAERPRTRRAWLGRDPDAARLLRLLQRDGLVATAAVETG
ncbi:MAG: hypothetical protein QNK03_17905, partial [Myxococcota bacterium]|nr:hypothetical protein [Myxococcota bacterium]